MEVLIIETGIKHDAIVRIDKVLIGSREAEYKIARVSATNIPL